MTSSIRSTLQCSGPLDVHAFAPGQGVNADPVRGSSKLSIDIDAGAGPDCSARCW